MISPDRAKPSPPTRRGPTRPQLAGIFALVLVLVFTGAFAATLVLTGGPDATATPSGIAYSSGSSTPGSTPTGSSTTEPSPTSTQSLGPTDTATPQPATATATVAPTSTVAPTGAPTVRPTPPPTTVPTIRPTIRPTAPPGGGPATYVSNGSRSSNTVALTFDFGGRVGDANAIVNYLIAHNVHATIFITGSQIDTTAEGPQVLTTICPRTAQFALGNHSYSHPNFSGLTVAQMQSQLSTTEAAFAKYCDRSPRPYFRPPSGDLGKWGTAKYTEIMATLGAAGYARAIMWDCDTIDWDPNTTKQNIIDRVHAKAQSGSIVLMHLGGYATLAALPSVIADVQAKGLTPVTLTELGI